MKWRYTITILAAGQPRAYADTIYRCQILIEWQGVEGYKNKDAPFVPSVMDDEMAMRHAKMHYGWTEKDEGDWASTRLSYFKKIAPGTWEWETRAAFTD